MTDTGWVIRVEPRRGESGHPEYLGPYTRAEAQTVCARLDAVGRTFEVAALVTEVDLPGLYRP